MNYWELGHYQLRIRQAIFIFTTWLPLKHAGQFAPKLYNKQPVTHKNAVKGRSATDGIIARTEDSLFVGTGRFEDCRVIKFNQKGEIKAKIGCSPQISSARTANPQVNQAYIGVVKASPNNRSYAIACRYADQIEVFHSNDTTQAFLSKDSCFSNLKQKLSKECRTGSRMYVRLCRSCRYGSMDHRIVFRTHLIGKASQPRKMHCIFLHGTAHR